VVSSLCRTFFPGGSRAINCTNGRNVGNNYPGPLHGPNGTGEMYSFHAGRANILFRDGAVHFLAPTIDIVTYAALVTRGRGESLQPRDRPEVRSQSRTENFFCCSSPSWAKYAPF
jgi:prepilin-type processing-associated H-X9-DG protein